MRTEQEIKSALETLNPLYHCGDQKILFSEEEREQYDELLRIFFIKRRKAIAALYEAGAWDKLQEIGIFPERSGISKVIDRAGRVY